MTPLKARVVCLHDLHDEMTEEDIRQLFRGYTIIDQIRTINPSLGTNSRHYVLFSTVQDRKAVVEKCRDLYIGGRRVNIRHAPIGNYDCKFNIWSSPSPVIC